MVEIGKKTEQDIFLAVINSINMIFGTIFNKIISYVSEVNKELPIFERYYISLSTIPQLCLIGTIGFNKKDIVTNIAGSQSHHILPKASKEFNEIFARAGLDIDHGMNRIMLPDHIEKSLYPTKRSLHSGKHLDEYWKDASEEVVELLDQGKKDGWDQIKYKSEIEKFLKPLRTGLESDKIKLNEALTQLEKITLGK